MTLQSILKLRHRISAQLYAAISFTVFLTIVAVLVAWQSFERVGESQQRVNEGSLPEMVAAFAIARTSAALVAAAPRLTSAVTQEELDVVVQELSAVRSEFREFLVELEALAGEAGQFSLIGEKADNLVSNIDRIDQSVSQNLAITEKTSEFRGRLNAYEEQLRVNLLPAIDDQFFFVVTGYTELGIDPEPVEIHKSDGEINEYRFLTELEKNANIAMQLLATSSIIDDGALIGVLREQFETTSDGIARSLQSLGDTERAGRLEALFDTLFEFGFAEGNGFELRLQELEILEEQGILLQDNQELAVELVDEVERLVAQANTSAIEAAQASEAAVATASRVLLALGATSIVVAVLVSWLFVGRVLLRRLQALSDRMRGMAGGELEKPVRIEGHDEIADMAAALEVFRAHALEVQRLNLVEKLAKEVQDKNSELESVLNELKAAQNQIVMREKLAALGELTAGVAHEIKNPLNFVKNFAESSQELLEELIEELDMTEESREEQLDEIRSIAEILVDNLKRIEDHGGRADRIVHDMLSMGRGDGKAQEVDLNVIVQENTKLAFHGARASIDGFQLKIIYELDPNVGSAIVVPQDLGRVILNMVGNAGYETHKKLQAVKEEVGEGVPAGYEPELKVTTKRRNSRIRISIRDNGNGIPQEIISKIFNPFFTTKPTDQGTGLGLALSNDIVQQHGGSISVQSNEGQFTEMTIEIPDDASSNLAAAEAVEREEEDEDEDW